MSVEKIQRDLTNLFNYPSDPNPTTQADYINAVKNWVGNVINLVDIGLWQPETAYAVGAIVRTPSLPVFALKCITAGTSDLVEPDYTDVSEGDTVQDNNIEWMICTISTTFEVGKANIDASNIGVNAETDNSELWGSAIGGGEIAEDDGKLVTGGTVHAVTSVLASDIADNTDDIATNTDNIAQNATDIGIADKRISNIEKLLQGNLYDYQTDSSSAYTKSVPAGAMPYAGVEKVGGKTVVWNQLVQNGNFADGTTGWSAYSNPYFALTATDGVMSCVATGNTNRSWQVQTPVNITAGHKYLIRGSFKRTYTNIDTDANTTTIIFFGNETETVGSISTPTAGTTYALDSILTATKNNTTMVIGFGTINSTADMPMFDVWNIMLIDLTLCYGAGNEPTTVAEFEAMFPADYYEYNAGTLLSAGVTEVVSNGANLIPTYTTSGSDSGLTWVVNADGSVTINGTATGTVTIDAPASTWRWDGTTPCWLSGCPAGGDSGMGYALRVDAGVSYSVYDVGSGIALANSSGTIDGKALKFRIVIRSGKTCNNLIFKPMLNYGTSAKPYAPYVGTIANYPIPAAVQALDGYGWSAGTAYNYIDFERKKFVKNVDKIVLDGTQSLALTNWRPQTNSVAWAYYYSVAADVKVSTLNILSASLQAVSYWTIYDNDVPSIAARTNESYSMFVRVADTSLTTPTAINNYLSANPITVYYELGTPVEIDISEYLTDDNLIQVESGGTLTFPNSNGDDYRLPVPSEETYMIDLQSAIGG